MCTQISTSFHHLYNKHTNRYNKLLCAAGRAEGDLREKGRVWRGSARKIGGQVDRCAPTGQTATGDRSSIRFLPNAASSVIIVGTRGVPGRVFIFPSAAAATAVNVGAFILLPRSVIPRHVHGSGRLLLVRAQRAGGTEVTCPEIAEARVCLHRVAYVPQTHQLGFAEGPESCTTFISLR